MSQGLGEFLGAIVRAVEDREHNGRPARAVIATAAYETDIEDLWDAMTNIERIPRWFSPVSGDFRLGGTYTIEGNASGRITECDAPHRLGLTWEFAGTTTWVTLDLYSKDEGRSSLRLEHVAEVTKEGEEFWEKFGPGAVGVGWDLSIEALARYLRTGEQVEAADSPARLQTGDGRELIQASSDAWRDASLRYGTDRESANISGNATVAFYTGGSPQ